MPPLSPLPPLITVLEDTSHCGEAKWIAEPQFRPNYVHSCSLYEIFYTPYVLFLTFDLCKAGGIYPKVGKVPTQQEGTA